MINNMKKNEIIRETRYTLVGNWFYNMLQGKINDSVLVICGAEMFPYISDLRQFVQNLKEKHSCGECRVESFVIFPKMEKNFDQNLVFTTLNEIDFTRLHKTKRKILFIDVAELIEDGFLKNGLNKLYSAIHSYKEAPVIKAEDFNFYYIKQYNPIELLNRDAEQLKDFLYLLLNNRGNCRYSNCKDILLRGYYFDIEIDIQYLVDEQILTSRLAIILYKMAFLNTDKNIDTLIGKFYHKHLGVKSVKCTNKHLGINGVKGYKLNFQ
jgi:hypothetical protein